MSSAISPAKTIAVLALGTSVKEDSGVLVLLNSKVLTIMNDTQPIPPQYYFSTPLHHQRHLPFTYRLSPSTYRPFTLKLKDPLSSSKESKDVYPNHPNLKDLHPNYPNLKDLYRNYQICYIAVTLVYELFNSCLPQRSY
jgi:hypothetical protein